MNLNNPQAMGIPRQNPAFPMAQLRDNPSGGLYNYNQPTEVIGGYDAKINPMTGQEIPQVNFAGGGLASLLESKGRRGDTMLVHMAPEEVRGLQALALAHGGTLTVNPETGLYEASFLKKLLPTIIGAIVPSVPGLGTLAKTIGFGNTALGTSLLVGGASALIEGDLKKGLEAGLGAYSGANIAQSLRAASAAANAAASQAPAIGAEELEKLKQLPKIESAVREAVGGTTSAPQLATAKIREFTDPLAGKALPGLLTVNPLAEVATNKLPILQQPSVMGGIKGLFTSPEARTAFGEALGGGFKSPFMQQMAKTATFSGIANALSPEPKPLPTGGAMGEDFIYVPGGFNPLYGTGRDQPYQLPGKYYKRTPQGLVPYNPFALAPGVRGFADGGQVGVAPPKNTPFAELALDPNVAATRSYIEELNRRAKNPPTYTYPGMGSTGLGGTNQPYVPDPYTGGGGDVGGGGGSLTGSPTGDLVAGLVGQELVRKGLEKGVGAIRDKFATGEFFPSPDDLTGVEPEGRLDVVRDPMSGVNVSTLPIAGLPALTGADFRTPSVTIEELGTAEVPGEPPVSVQQPASSFAPAAIGAGVMGGSAMLLPTAGRTGQVLIEGIETVGDAIGSSVANSAGAGVGAGGAAGAAGGAGGTSTGIFGLEKGAPLTGKAAIIPGLQTVLGLHQAYEGIRKGNEVQSALGGFGAATGIASLAGYSGLATLGPIGLAAAAVAALGSSMVNTKEYGDKALENYWKAVDQGRGFGQAPPEELAQGFINFYRTNKNNFPGQEKYGRTGNEDFVYDMTQVINDAVKSGKIGKGADATTIYEQVVQPWLGSMGPGPQNEDARRVQDFMMTDLIHNFMKGAPISNAQVKGDKNFKIVSERPVYAGTPPSDMQMYGQMPAGFQGRPDELRGIGRDEFRTPFSAPEEREFTMPTPFSEPQAAAPPPPTPFSEPQIVEEAAPIPYSPRIIEEEPVAATAPVSKFDTADLGFAAPTPFSEPQRESIPTPFSEPVYYRQPEPEPVYREPEPVYIPPVYREPEPVYREPEPVYYRQPEPEPVYYRQPEPEPRDYIPTPFSEPEVIREPEPVYREPEPVYRREYEMFSPFSEFGEGEELRFNYGGAVGEDYNFGFARGGMPNEYQAGGKLLDGPGDGMSDDIPAVIRGKGVQRAALADGEFVIPADVVSHLGNGSTKAGAKKLYDMMARVRQARTGRTKQAPAVKTTRLLPA